MATSSCQWPSRRIRGGHWRVLGSWTEAGQSARHGRVAGCRPRLRARPSSVAASSVAASSVTAALRQGLLTPKQLRSSPGAATSDRVRRTVARRATRVPRRPPSAQPAQRSGLGRPPRHRRRPPAAGVAHRPCSGAPSPAPGEDEHTLSALSHSRSGRSACVRSRRSDRQAPKSWVHQGPPVPSATPTPSLVRSQSRMFARWPGLSSQASITAAASAWPKAMFSARE